MSDSKLDEVRKSLSEAAGKVAINVRQVAEEVKTVAVAGLETARKTIVDVLTEDKDLSPEQLDDKYNKDGDDEHPTFTRQLWKKDVVEDKTLFGYWQWVSWSLRK